MHVTSTFRTLLLVAVAVMAAKATDKTAGPPAKSGLGVTVTRFVCAHCTATGQLSSRGNSDNCSCQAPEVFVYTCMYQFVLVYTSTYQYNLEIYFFYQHAHIENIKTVANLTKQQGYIHVHHPFPCTCWIPPTI